MNILHINLADMARGAAKAALRLHDAQIQLGHTSQMLVGAKLSERAEIEMLPRRDTPWQRRLYRIVNKVEKRTGLQYLWQPWRKQFLTHRFSRQADVINLHNIHSGYFSHRILPQLSRMVPIVWTFHDFWPITGHCGFPYLLDCDRWKTGCGNCPSLSDYPPLDVDTTARLWRIKSRIYQDSEFTVVTPSQWMAEIVRQSPLLKKSEVLSIPHGLDTDVFIPSSKAGARKSLGLPEDARIVLFSAFDAFQTRKGGKYLFDSMQRLFDEGKTDLLLLMMGNERSDLGGEYSFPVHPLGLVRDESAMAEAYSAADLYAGPSLAETFGLVYIEAMACGTPVIAFDCTAVSEVIRHMETGYLARPKDLDDLTHGLRLLLDDCELRQRMSRQSRDLVLREFTLERQAQRHIKLYENVIARHGTVAKYDEPGGPLRASMATNPENTSTNASSRGLQVVPKNRKGDLARWIDRGLAFRADPSSTLVISGFWRSGTTWIEESLREILHAKTLFEPLCPFAEDAKKIIAHGGVEHQSIEFLRMYMPYCGGENLNGHPLYKLYHRALCSTSGGSWVRRFRKGIGESFRSRHVIKFVRAQLCLRAAQNTFGMPVLHIWRDPRAVIASIKKTRWHWLFDHLKVQEQLLDRDDGRTEYFGRWRNEILEFDRSDAVARIAAYWALTEKYVRDCYTDDPKNFVCVSFETIVREREQEVAKILGRLELRPARADFKVSDRDSTTTSKPQRGTSVDERVAGWRSYLSETEIAEIESVIQYFGLSDRLDDDRAKMQADVDPAIVD